MSLKRQLTTASAVDFVFKQLEEYVYIELFRRYDFCEIFQ